jgi:DNA-binding beta-propeller fold protein YncE
VGGDGEEAVIGADGLIYVNSENTAEVVVFDPKSLEVKKRLPIRVAKTPTGLAYDPKTNRLFIGCRNEPMMAVMDAATGKVINSFPIGANVNEAAPANTCRDNRKNVFPGVSFREVLVLIVVKQSRRIHE